MEGVEGAVGKMEGADRYVERVLEEEGGIVLQDGDDGTKDELDECRKGKIARRENPR